MTADAKAIPMAVASTPRVKSSREPSASTRCRIHGSTREPTTSINAVSSAAFPSAAPTLAPIPRIDAGSPPDTVARIGRRTNATTVNRSSTINQPIATLLASDSVDPRCRRARSSTTVLATEIARPRTTADCDSIRRPGRRGAEPDRDRDLCNRAGHRHPVDVQQIAQAEVEPHPEHQQGDTDLGQLERRGGVGNETRRERPDGDPGQEVSDDRRDADESREIAGNERRAERDRDGGDEVGAVRLDGAMLRGSPVSDRGPGVGSRACRGNLDVREAGRPLPAELDPRVRCLGGYRLPSLRPRTKGPG